ncbi:hypothetical protein GCM10011342_28960 [Aquisalinus flavus]|uniref:Uncharacterized protein n=1 Tax=Aquisalinus flavus TaxID=1526572 RepID=A0A8J2V350_9PROT|nr:hypothetical protein [Aquisalinus flavus]MBD0428124.1 hypothetical protein [Aquisalinus flavus]GGD18500.1 hypothetical protein GCM10011342_28960 [Aquisalinus flavus]
MAEHGKFAADAASRIGADGAGEAGESRFRRWAPWGGAIIGNSLILLIFGLVLRVSTLPGVPDPDETIPVFVLTPEDLLPEPEETAEDFTPPPEPEEPESAEANAPVSPAPEIQEPVEEPPAPVVAETPESEIEADPPPTPRPAPAAPSPAPLPDVDLPQARAGGPAGVVALRCNDIFSDPDKAAECAGRTEIRSGWTRGDEDWSGIVSSLRRGGIDVPDDGPLIGPPTGDLPEGSVWYEPFDEGLLIGRDRARWLRIEQKFDEWKGASQGVSEQMSPVDNIYSGMGIDTPYFLERWEPSWTLRDDPYVDPQIIDELIADRERARREAREE